MAKTSKIKTKKMSVQVTQKLALMDDVKEFLQSKGFKIVDCREISIEGSTKFTLYVRNSDADCKITFISKPDKKSPYYIGVDEALGEKLCDDEI